MGKHIKYRYKDVALLQLNVKKIDSNCEVYNE